MKKVGVFLAEGFEEIEALTVVDLLRRAEIYVDIISVEAQEAVRGSHGICVQADTLFEETDFSEYHMLVLPGGMPGTTNLQEHRGVCTLVKRFLVEGKYVAAICAAPVILSGLGLLRGKRVTCYPLVEQQLQGAVLTGGRTAVDGQIITGRSAGGAVEFALKIIEILAGEEKAGEIAEGIVYE
ncbi:DJ-1/PfpI family protein [Clostridiaceae bacterium 68-1-5]|uniref:DJ-1/PfpI family protein n=1 Tax=Suipraeoptans intestinalis TaxID=2606628 RepID=A0A6N7UT12_9FIRM|nr:DJ-1 family glyoxalase III [Suipraeoptans intestinalis]MSR94443.1 DJ-1/PfpI family protein [Suipraeoptans intestinalis]